MGKKVKLEDLFDIDYDECDGTFNIKVKPLFNKQRINIYTDFGRIMIDHWFKGKEVIEVTSSTILDSRPILNNISLEGFEKSPPEGYGCVYIVIKRNRNTK